MPRIKLKQKTARRASRLVRSIDKVAQDEGYVILPSTQLRINAILKRAQKAGTLRDPEQVVMARVALTAAALEAAHEQGRGRVTIKHLREGWLTHLAYGGNCPPHMCLFRSVISREDRVRKAAPLYDKLRSEVKE